MIQMQKSRQRDSRDNFAKAALLAAPFLLAGCASDMPMRPSPAVVTISEAKSGYAAPWEAEAGPKRAPSKALSTVLNVNGYQGELLVANLSVVLPDNSLDRIIVDPIVTFSSLNSSGAWEFIPGCIRVSTCVVGPDSGRKAVYRAEFTSETGSALKPALSEPFVFEKAE